MATRQYRSSNSRRLILPAVSVAFLAYFAYHAFHGEYGFSGKAVLTSRTVQLEQQLSMLQAEREELEIQVGLLRSTSLDQDMLDEEARRQLSMVHPNEVVIMRSFDAALQNN